MIPLGIIAIAILVKYIPLIIFAVLLLVLLKDTKET